MPAGPAPAARPLGDGTRPADVPAASSPATAPAPRPGGRSTPARHPCARTDLDLVPPAPFPGTLPGRRRRTGHGDTCGLSPRSRSPLGFPRCPAAVRPHLRVLRASARRCRCQDPARAPAAPPLLPAQVGTAASAHRSRPGCRTAPADGTPAKASGQPGRRAPGQPLRAGPCPRSPVRPPLQPERPADPTPARSGRPSRRPRLPSGRPGYPQRTGGRPAPSKAGGPSRPMGGGGGGFLEPPHRRRVRRSVRWAPPAGGAPREAAVAFLAAARPNAAPDAVGATSKSSSRPSSPPTCRRRRPFPKTRPSSSGARRPADPRAQAQPLGRRRRALPLATR